MLLALYIVCLVFGGVLIAMSIFSGMEGDASATEVSFDADAGIDMDMDAGMDMGGDMDLDADSDFSGMGEGVSAITQFFNFRSLIFFTCFFGLTGAVLNLLGHGIFTSLPSAIVMGLFLSILMHTVMVYVKKTETMDETRLSDYAGLRASVIMPVSSKNKGKVTFNAKDGLVQLTAVIAVESDRRSFKNGEAVIIVSIDGRIAHIAEENFLST